MVISHQTDDHDDDDIIQLPSDTLQLLQEFQLEKDARAKQFEDLKQAAEAKFDTDGPLSMELFGEDWNASQFWYTDATARTLARQLLKDADIDTSIAVVSAPSVYIQLRNLLREDLSAAKPKVVLFEFDQRFEVFGQDFVPYDFKYPLRLPADLKGKFDRIICDPPFLSDDCQTKTALTVRYLAQNWSADGLKLISCTGERMETAMLKLYGKLSFKTTTFEPQHSKGLGNEFRCYANFECEEWKWRA